MKARWKEAILTWVGVNFTAFVLTFVLNPLSAGWPWLASFLLFNSLMVAGLTWLVMPTLLWLARNTQEASGDKVDELSKPHSS